MTTQNVLFVIVFVILRCPGYFEIMFLFEKVLGYRAVVQYSLLQWLTMPLIELSWKYPTCRACCCDNYDVRTRTNSWSAPHWTWMDRHIGQMRRETARKRRFQTKMVEDPSQRVTNLTDYGFPASRPKITGKLSILIKYNQKKYSEQFKGTKIFSANKFKCFSVIHWRIYNIDMA